MTARTAATRRPQGTDDAADIDLQQRHHRERRPADREALVRRYLPLARHVAARYHGGGEPLDDLEQVASLGLIKAIDRFDPGRGTSFSSYAVPTITGELRRYFRDCTWSLRVPRDLQETAVRINRVEPDLQLELGRAPTAAELADRLGCTAETVLEAREAAGANRMASLDAPLSSGEEGASLADRLGAGDARMAEVERALSLESALECLGARDRQILRLRFHEELTQAEIGRRVGLSQMHVSRLIRQALARLGESGERVDGLREAA
ncbi:MAG: SigB/SigF/SigG family RNA polymerase sigma factor [Solirubrobacteraceae bacterium]